MVNELNGNDYLTAPTKVRVLRPFYFEGKVLNPVENGKDVVVELPRAFALELCAVNKAELVR